MVRTSYRIPCTRLFRQTNFKIIEKRDTCNVDKYTCMLLLAIMEAHSPSKRLAESADRRENRLRCQRQRDKARRASETVEQMEVRLGKLSDRAKRATRSRESTEAVLQRRSDRLAAETAEERERPGYIISFCQ